MIQIPEKSIIICTWFLNGKQDDMMALLQQYPNGKMVLDYRFSHYTDPTKKVLKVPKRFEHVEFVPDATPEEIIRAFEEGVMAEIKRTGYYEPSFDKVMIDGTIDVMLEKCKGKSWFSFTVQDGKGSAQAKEKSK